MCCIKKLGKLSLVPEAKDAPVTSFASKSRALGGFFFSFLKFVYLAVLGLDCFTGFSLVASRGYSLGVVPVHGVWVQTLVGELRSHVPHGQKS